MFIVILVVLIGSLLPVQGSEGLSRSSRTHSAELPPTREEFYMQMVESLLRRYHEKLLKSNGQVVSDMGPSVWVGPSAPDQQETLPDEDYETEDTLMAVPQKKELPSHPLHPYHSNYPIHLNHRLIRSRGELSEEICKTHRYWKQINETSDIYGRDVVIVHTNQYRQFAFVYECIGEGQGCSGVSESVQSACEMRPGWANMLHRRKDAVHSTPQWGYVAVPHHCGCRIYPRMGPLVSN